MFRIDNKYYDAEYLVKDGYSQTADILNGDNSSRLQLTGSMYLDYLGTFFNSDITLRRGRDCKEQEWNNLFLELCNPINQHNIDIPFGNGILTLDVYISQVKRNLIRVNYGSNIWQKTYSFTATAIDSNWLAGGSLQGYTEG